MGISGGSRCQHPATTEPDNSIIPRTNNPTPTTLDLCMENPDGRYLGVGVATMASGDTSGIYKGSG